jgi:transposase
MVAELVDAVVGGDTHRDTHTLEMVTPVGATIATLTIDNDDAGFARTLAWIADRAPGPRIVVGLEGTRSFGIGLTRALGRAGLTVVEVERSLRAKRRRGKSDPIDARRAAEHVLRMDADRMPTPRADGDREALRILVSARSEIAVNKTRQISRLKALLLTGDDADRDLARGALTILRLTAIARRRGNGMETVEQAVRRAETRRLAIAIRDAERALAADHQQPHHPREQLRARLTQPPRRRPGHRRPSHPVLVPPWPLPQRRRVCCSRRCRPGPSQQR